MMKLKKLVIFFAAALFLAACVKAPYTERSQLILLSETEEAEVGVTAFRQVKEKSKLETAPEINSLVDRVGRRIASAADKPEYKWEFVVIRDKTVNAFALPGGKVAFYEGILPLCADESGVAVVMGHEVAHALARHGAERMSQSQILAIGQTALMTALGSQDPATREAVLQAYGVGATVGVALPYSRTHEYEADEIGLILMAKAGYDPNAAVNFWKRMAEASKGGGVPDILATHPSDEKRIKRLASLVPKAMPYYDEAISKHPEWKRPPEPVKLK